MCNPLTILEKIAEKIMELVFQEVVNQVRYITQYKMNVKDLEAEKKALEERCGKIDTEVGVAQTLGNVIVDGVSDWVKVSEEKKQAIEKFMDKKTDEENMQCCMLPCPNVISRYRLSKQAKEMIGDVKDHTQKGNFNPLSRPAPRPTELEFPSTADYVSFDSRASVFKMIVEALKDSNVKMVGLHGTGGIGKTTMVVEVGKRLKKDGVFDEVVVAVVSKDVNVRKIQEELADRLNIQLHGASDVGRANVLWPRLANGKKNLVILDDVWTELDLKTIGIPITDGNKGCKVVLTSRIRRVCKNMRADRDFPMEVLSEGEAWALFKREVGNSVELSPIADAVCKECQGLPIAIRVVGAALKGRDNNAWNAALIQLKNCRIKDIEGIDPQMYASLKLSYDWLQTPGAKSCFLLCSLFPEDADISIDDLVRHFMARRLLDLNPNTLQTARCTVLTFVDTLKNCSLLLVGTQENNFKMHDVIRDVAISIAKDEEAFLVKHNLEEWPEEGMDKSPTAISLRFDKPIESPEELVYPELHTLLLAYTKEYHRMPLRVPETSFSEVNKKLTSLELNRVIMLPIPSSLENLVSLRMLCLNNCKLAGLSILEGLKNNLEMLSLRGSDMDEMPPEIGQLTRLRLLDLRDCDGLKVIPSGVISKLTRLEELYIGDCFDQWETLIANKEGSVIASLAELEKLTKLTTLHIHIPNVRLLPEDFQFQNLERFQISVGGKFEYDKKSSSARILKLIDAPLKKWLYSLLYGAEVLYLQKLEGLNKVLDERDEKGFSELKYLQIESCVDLEYLLCKPKLSITRNHGVLYNPSRSFNKLTELRIKESRLKYLFPPSCARALGQLQKLVINDCNSMEEIVGIEGGIYEEELTFSKLKEMTLHNLPNLRSFYPKTATTDGNTSTHAQPLFNEKVGFPALENLEIYDMPNITEIWDEQLLLVPAESFHQLSHMRVSNCDKLENVFTPNMLHCLQNLNDLQVENCQEMEVKVSKKAKETREASDDIIEFPRLRELSLVHLKSLRSFCSSSSRTSNSQPLFSNEVAFPALENLEIYDMPNITEIWDEQLLLVPAESFHQLSHMRVSNCDKLENVFTPNMLHCLPNLNDLRVENCQEMEVIVSKKAKETREASDDIIEFPRLRGLRLLHLKSLKSFWSSSSRTSNSQPLFSNEVAFPALNYFEIGNLPDDFNEYLEHLLLEREVSFPALKYISVNRQVQHLNWYLERLVSQREGCASATMVEDVDEENDNTEQSKEEHVSDVLDGEEGAKKKISPTE